MFSSQPYSILKWGDGVLLTEANSILLFRIWIVTTLSADILQIFCIILKIVYLNIRPLELCSIAQTVQIPTYVCIFVQLCNKQYIKLSIFVSLYNKPLKKLTCDSIYFINRVLTVYIVHPVEAVVFHSLRSTKNKNKTFFYFLSRVFWKNWLKLFWNM